MKKMSELAYSYHYQMTNHLDLIYDDRYINYRMEALHMNFYVNRHLRSFKNYEYCHIICSIEKTSSNCDLESKK